MRYLNTKDIREMFGLGKNTLWEWRKLGKFPSGKRMPGGHIRWRESEVIAWFNALDDAK